MADIDSLSIQISTDSTKAVNGLNALSSTLEKLKTATKGGLGLTSVANQVKKLGDSANGINSTTISNIKGLANAMEILSKVGDFKISSSIANQLTKINGALAGLNVGDGANKITELVSALKPLETLGKSSLSSTVNALNKLPEALQKLDTRQLYTQIQSLTRIMQPLATEMQKIANGFNAFPGRIQRLIQGNERLSASNSRLSTSYVNIYAKLRMAYTAIKTVAKGIASLINKSSTYIENMNLFSVAMGEYASEAREYAETVGEVMGIDPGEWARNQGVFMTLATGFGVVGDRAYKMSKNLTQLGYDISSFFNIPYEDAMQKLQSGLAGELEPLRRIGYDLSVARLQQEAYTLGISKKVSAMTQAEKAELRYHAIMTQVTTAQGDMARTLEAPANQMRILKAQIDMAGRALGNIFLPVLQAILPYLIATAKVVRTIADIIAGLFGVKLPDFSSMSLGGLSSGAEDYGNALDDASDSAKKLQKYTMGFDELNVIDPNQGSGSGNSSGGVGGTGFDFELPEYNFMEGLAESKVGQIVSEMKEWLGLTGEINSWSDFFNTNLGQILILAGEIGVAIGAWKLTTGLMTGIVNFKALLKGLGKSAKGFKIATGVTLAVTGLTIEWTGVIDALRNGLDGLNFAEIIGGSGLIVAGGAIIGKTLGSTILGSSIGAIVAGIPMFFTGIYDACINGLNWLNGLLIPAGATLTGAGIGAIIGMLGGPIGAGIGALIGLAVGALTDLGILIYQKWDEIKEFFAPTWDWLYDNIFAPIGDFFSGVADWFYTNVIQPIIDFFSPVLDAVLEIGKQIYDNATEIIGGIITAIGSILSKVEEIFLKIVEIAVALGKAFYDYVITPIVDFIKGLAEKVYDKVIKPIMDFFKGVGVWVYDTIISPIWNKIIWLRDKAVELFKKIGTTVVTFVSGLFKSVINGILTAIENTINGFLRLLNGAINLINEIPGVNITHIELLSIPRLADGGTVDTGQMFIAREAGPELVGNIGRKTAVVNNEQIVSSVSRGVAEANSEQNTLLREQNSLLRAMLEKGSNIYLDGKKVTSNVEKHQRERGRTILVGGVV